MKKLFLLPLSGFFLALLFSFASKTPDRKYTSEFHLDKLTFSSTGSNPYFILQPGYQQILKGTEGKDSATLVITVLDETKTIGNVETRVVEENETVGGKPEEISRNYFAYCKETGAIFYFGEDVTLFNAVGEQVHGKDSWEATGDNKAGMQFPGEILIGSRYYQEQAPGIAMDRAEIISDDNTFTTPAGTFTNVLKTEETTPLEIGDKEYKLYAPGVGLLKDEDLILVEYGFLK
ncbi:MAG TPA: hypothetical protein VL651_00545 [Bacteroidia bacterium]|jgi:hypothetical protein|nr:hypothetical protein [Bacteroidia bacterium]